MNFRAGVTFLFGEEIHSVRDDQAHVADAGLINAGVINLVQDSVTEREPHMAIAVEGGADAGFSAGSPARRNSGAAWGGTILYRQTIS